jgi:uncharacterized protein (DUF2336 family)
VVPSARLRTEVIECAPTSANGSIASRLISATNRSSTDFARKLTASRGFAAAAASWSAVPFVRGAPISASWSGAELLQPLRAHSAHRWLALFMHLLTLCGAMHRSWSAADVISLESLDDSFSAHSNNRVLFRAFPETRFQSQESCRQQ